MYCTGGNATDPIWRVLASSDGISSWNPLIPQHNNPNPNPLANHPWCIDFLTPSTPLIIPHRLAAFLESLIPLKNWCSIHARWSKSSLKQSIRFCGIFPSLKHNFIAYSSSKVSDCILETHQLWQSGLSHHPHHHVVPPARISLTLSRHFSLSFISSGRCSGLHAVSSHSCCM